MIDDIFDSPERFQLRPRDVAFSKVENVYNNVKAKILGFQPEFVATGEELMFDDEAWRGNGEITGLNDVYLESIDAVISVKGLIKVSTEKNGSGHELLAVTFLTDASDVFPDTDNFPIEARPEDEKPVGFGEVLLGQEMAPILICSDFPNYAISGGRIDTENLISRRKIEITDRDAEVLVAKLIELQDYVTGYDPSTFPDNQNI